jgi:hypothetical protein
MLIVVKQLGGVEKKMRRCRRDDDDGESNHIYGVL